ncbi:MAG TPA: protein kinase [Gemmatimonadales bacterium]|nr:protein kinase [Gemmatimonadales bacterium]
MDEAQLLNNPLAERLSHILEGAYELEGEIGRGGMGVVFAARDLKLKRRVAIKVLPPELAFRDEIRKRFLREAQTAARLSHPNIVPIHAVGDEGGLVYFVMGYVDGESLGARLRRRHQLPVEEVRRIMKETADALGLAHAMGIVHRDIKPDNILLEGTRRRVMVTDFGIAKALSDVGGPGGTLTGTGVAIGTPHYMSPEQAAGGGEIDARSDLYSLGVVAFEMVTGELPFQAPTVPGILMKHVTEPAPDVKMMRPEVSEDLAATINRCLEKDPSSRWPTADSLRRALESRKSVPYRPGGSAARRGMRSRGVPASRGLERAGERSQAALDRGWSRQESALDRGWERRAARRAGERGVREYPGGSNESPMVRRFRAEFARYAVVCGGLVLLNVATGIREPWSLFVVAGWGFAIGNKFTRLWHAGYSWRDVFHRPAAHDSVDARNDQPSAPGAVPRGAPARQVPAGDAESFGQYQEQIRRMNADRTAVQSIVAKLPESERQLLPDVVQTVDALAKRATELGRTLVQMSGEVDGKQLERLDRRIGELKDESGAGEPDRRIDLLERQRQTLVELLERRRSVEAQFESCVLAVQNVRFDLLRLRSAGVAAVLDDLTSATQQARALSFDVEAAIDAAGEIKRELGR